MFNIFKSNKVRVDYLSEIAVLKQTISSQRKDLISIVGKVQNAERLRELKSDLKIQYPLQWSDAYYDNKNNKLKKY